MKRVPALVLGLFLSLASMTALAGPAEIVLILFDDGRPVPRVSLEVDGETLGRTGDDGGLVTRIPAGRHDVRLLRGGETLSELDLLVDADESVQIIGSIAADGTVEIDIEASGGARGRVRSSDEEQVADPGALSGRVLSAENGDAVSGAKIYFSGVELSATTDAGGNYAIELPAGNYEVSVVHPSFATQTLDNVRVIAGRQVTSNIELSPAGVQLSEYVVTAPYVEGSVAAVFSQQRESTGVTDILGAEQMSRAGDSNAADALKRVTGLTIEDGKFVVIRGQPARYTKTLWNGSPLPSPDPIKRIVPLDLFPTGVLSQIGVEKSYDARFPGSFGAGLIALETTSTPEEAFAEVSVSTGINTNSTGEEGFDYEGGDRDFLGTDDGTRELPGSLEGLLGAPGTNSDDLEQPAQDLSNIWELDNETLPPDMGLGISGGNRFDALGGKLGLSGAFSWGRKYRYTERIDRDFALAGDGSLAVRNDQVEKRTDMNVDIGGLFSAELDWDEHVLTSNTFIIRKTQQRAEVAEGTRVVSDDLFIRDTLLEWNERELLAQQFLGEHEFERFTVDWRAMLADSSRDSPDRRNYIYRRQSNGEFVFFNRGGAQRRFSESEDEVDSLDIDLTVPVFERETLALDLGTGVSTFSQDRESRVRRIRIDALPSADITQDPEDLLDPANIGDTLEANDDTQTNDNYLGDASVDGIYLRGDLEWRQWRLVAGVRQETSEFNVRTFVAGGSAGGQQVEGGFERTDTLPSLSATWRFRDDMQLRASFGSSISRPVLNELSPARYFDPDTGEEFLGNPDLEPAEIDSLDLRWEWYPSERESVSLGFFTKDYTNPIEESFVGVGGSSFLRQVQNADSATVSGVEASARSDLLRVLGPLGLDADWATRVYVQANLAAIDSEVELASQNLATSATRPLQGQADSIFNLQVGYDGGSHDATVSLNRVGERLRVAGVQGQPDVFQEPIVQLDAKYTYRWSDDLRLELSGSNLLDEDVELLQGGRVFSFYSPGVDISASLKYRF